MTPTKEQLKQFVNQLNEATKKEVITIETTPVAELPLTSSKFSGLPYVPKGGSLPTDEQGNSFLMLAQINCEQLPENSLYPKKGLLQFWIAATDDYLYGIDFDNPCSNDNKRVLYYPTIGEALPIDGFAEHYTFEDCYLPFDADLQFAISFRKEIEAISLAEKAAHRFFVEKWNETFLDTIEHFWFLPNDTCEKIYDLLDKEMGHKIGVLILPK